MTTPAGFRRRLAALLIRALVPSWARESARGDLDEERAGLAQTAGDAAADRWYLRAAAALSVRYLVERWRRAPSPGRRMRPVGDLRRDLTLAIRQLRARPIASTAAVLTLGLAIGANTAVFALVNGALFKPLTRHEPDRVVRLYTRAQDGAAAATFSYRDYQTLRAGTRTVGQVAGVHLATIALKVERMPHQLLGEIASASYFDLLRPRLVAGRTITAADDRADVPPVALVSERYWRGRLAADPSTVGRLVTINGQPYAIVGIVADGFGGSFFGAPIDVWLPLETSLRMLGANIAADGSARVLQMLARLTADATRAQADAELAAFAAEVAKNRGDTRMLRLETGVGTLLHGRVRQMAVLFFGIVVALVGLVLVVAVSNVANLLLVRALARRREIAVRRAVGAGPWRIARQLLVESAVLAGLGLAAGALLAFWIASALPAIPLVGGLDLRLDLRPDWRVIAAMTAATGLAALAATLLPLVSALRTDPGPYLKEGGASIGSRRTARLRHALVVVQVTVGVVACVAGGLLARSARAAAATDLGFDRDRLFATDIDLDANGYDEPRGREFYRALIDRLRELPAVAAAALANRAPLDSSTPALRILRDGEIVAATPETAGVEVTYYVTTPEYFSMVGVPLMAGRGYGDIDRAGRPGVVVVNETFVRTLWPGSPPQQAIGRRLRAVPETTRALSIDREIEVIGVARDAKYRTVGEAPQPHVYLPLAQHHLGSVSLLVRARNDAPPLAETHAEIARLDPAVQGFFTRTFDEHTRIALLPARLASSIAGIVAVIAAVLGAIGLHAVVACVVVERTREFGLCLALGATPTRIARDVIRHSLRVVCIGAVLGVLIAGLTAGLLNALLYRVSAADPLVYVSVIGGAAILAAIAAWLPARRAARIPPTVILKG